jgi:hypothetical protein
MENGINKAKTSKSEDFSNFLVNIVSGTLYQIMLKAEERPSVFKNLKDNKSIQAFRSFIVNKVRGVSNNIKGKRSNRWTKGIKRKKRDDYHSPLNQMRRRQTSNWAKGGLYGPKITRKAKKVLKQKEEGN